MIICDLCKKNVPTKIYAFGKVSTDYKVLPNWDFCEDCSEKVLNKINEFVEDYKNEKT